MHHRKTRIKATGHLSCKALALAVAIAACLPVHAAAAEPDGTADAVVHFDIPAGDLALALERFSTQSGVQAMYRQELVAGKRAPAVNGALAPAAALTRLLANSGVTSERVNARTFVLKAAPRVTPAAEKPSRAPEAENPSHQEAKKNRVQEMDEVVVVGSRLGSSPVESAMPIKVITRDDIDRSGAGSIAQMLSYLPEIPINNGEERAISGLSALSEGANTNSTTVQMRGMPRGTTLVLINGRRAGDSSSFSNSGFFDLSTIPLSMVERIEVLPAGSSAVYGGDALAGVINIVLRRDANGYELRFRRDTADSFGNSQANAMWGRSWSRGSMTINGSWNKQSALYNYERGMTRDMDFRRFGGQDARYPSGFPATVYSLDGCPPIGQVCRVPVDERNPLPGLDYATAVVPAGSNGVDLAPEDFRDTQGQVSKQTARRHLVSPEERYGIHINGHFELRPSMEVFGELTYTQRDIPAWQAQLVISGGDLGHPTRSLVTADHPFNPFGVPVGVNFFYTDTGIFVSYAQKHSRGVLGLRGKAGRFDWEVSGWQSRDRSSASGGSYFDPTLIAEALLSTDPARTLNPFVSDGSAPASVEVLSSLLQTPLSANMATRTSGVTGFVRGAVASLPAGDVIALLGGEKQAFSMDVDSNSTVSIAPRVHGRTTSGSLFGEVRIPVLAARNAQSMERMALTGALRRETSERFEGAAMTKTIGVEIRPWNSLMLRSTYSTGFRPLVLHAMAQDPIERLGGAYDPRFGGSLFLFDVLTNGGVPENLRPETSRTITMGLVYQPSSDWRLSATHWSIEFFDQIAAVAPQTLVDNEEHYPGRVTRDPITGVIEHVDGRQINISLRDTAGIDIAFDGEWATSFGYLYPSLSATYTYRFDQRMTDASPVVSNVAIYNAAGWAPRWKIVPRVGWDYNDSTRAMLVGRYVSRYRDSTTYTTGPDAGTYPVLGEFWMFDLNLDFSVDRIFRNRPYLRGTTLAIGANNLFNRTPDFCAGCYNTGYDASQYDIMGRKLYFEVRKSF